MMKFFTRKPIELHCYTYRPDVFNYAPIQMSIETPRKFLKKLAGAEKTTSAKHCPSIRGIFNLGITMPLWSDLELQIPSLGDESAQWQYQYSDLQSSVDSHFFAQLNAPEQDKKFLCLKLESPWMFQCADEVDFLVMGEQLELLKYGLVQTMNGVLNFKHQHGTNINIIVSKKESKERFVLPFFTPILRLIPLTERKVTVVNHLITKEHFSNLKSSATKFSFSASYYQRKKIMAGKKSFVYIPEK